MTCQIRGQAKRQRKKLEEKWNKDKIRRKREEPKKGKVKWK